jgi:hypothetical protein
MNEMYGLILGLLGAPLGLILRWGVDRFRMPAILGYALLAAMGALGFLGIVAVNQSVSALPGARPMTNYALGGYVYLLGLAYFYFARGARRRDAKSDRRAP